MPPDYWKESKKILAKKDKTLAKVIRTFPEEEFLTRSNNSFEALQRSIVGQQLSVKAAHKIWMRFEALFKTLCPEEVLHGDPIAYRNAGLSTQKAKYVANIAAFFLENRISESYWQSQPLEKIYKDLTGIKGVGKWTVDMFAIFYLNHPDIFPASDLGVLKSIYQLYYHGEKKPLAEVLELSEKWKPYRSVATWYLWRNLDAEPVQY